MSVLELRAVSKVYGQGATEVLALDAVDLSVAEGALVAVMARAGKSTLLTISGALEKPSGGDVLVGGALLSTMSPNERARLRRRSIGYVFQDFNLLAGLTAAENVTMPLELDGSRARLSVLGVAVVALLFIALLAAAGFVVIAQRRQRQLGMLAAIGATERHLRLAMIANGAVIGAVAAVVGASVGVLGWFAVEPRLETAVGYRVDRFDIAWWVIVTGMVLAVGPATAAAWWPARVAARASIVQALSGRPPRPRAAYRSAAAASALIAAGVVCLAVAGDLADDRKVYWTNVVLVGVGTVATIVGVLLFCPLALRFARRLGGAAAGRGATGAA